jgi:hypothetical protein
MPAMRRADARLLTHNYIYAARSRPNPLHRTPPTLESNEAMTVKALVWTTRAPGDVFGKPKCIFIGDVQSIPRVGEYVGLREGFGCEKVACVNHNFVDGEVEITVATSDPENNYGPCLYAELLDKQHG